MKIMFEVIKESEGGYVAACHSECIFAEGDSLNELHDSITNAVDKRFVGKEKPGPESIQLMLYRE